MASHLPLIVGFGGFNAAGRVSGHRAYQRLVYESLSAQEQLELRGSLASLMGLSAEDEQEILNGTLIRKIEEALFDPEAAHTSLNVSLNSTDEAPVSFELSARQLPKHVPESWSVAPLDEEGRRFKVTLSGEVSARLPLRDEMQVKTAGQLPTGFDPGRFYRSTHHPKGLQMSVLGASDAINSLGITWETIIQKVHPDQVSVYSSSLMSQLDDNGYGGMMGARLGGKRVTSKQLSLGFNSMPADFTNAYVLGSVGSTGAVAGACATFLYNLRWAVEEIRRGQCKVAVVGCSEAPIIPEVIDGYAAMSALATDDNLRKLDDVQTPNYRRASRPFGENCGFTLAESTQYIVLMADDLAMDLGAEIYGAVPGVYVNADGYKKSISSPGAGNYLTMAKAVSLASNLLGESAVQQHSFVQAHGSSTPANRVTESKILHEVAEAFDIESWPVAAVKSYLGHSLGPASGDQLSSTLGVFAKGFIPGIKTIDKVADDVFADHLHISNKDIARDDIKVGFLNSKGFGGNNATATVFSPLVAQRYLKNHFSAAQLKDYAEKNTRVIEQRDAYLKAADNGDLQAKYHFGVNMIDESAIKVSKDSVSVPGFDLPVNLRDHLGFEGF